jgi:hypothetical protein
VASPGADRDAYGRDPESGQRGKRSCLACSWKRCGPADGPARWGQNAELGAQDEQCSVPYIRAQIVSFGRTDTSQEIPAWPDRLLLWAVYGAVCKTVGF